MAIEVEYLSIIINDSSIREKYKGGIDQFMKDADWSHEEDGEIHSLSFMDPFEAGEYLNLLVKRGLKFQEINASIDIAVFDIIAGLRGTCNWLTSRRMPQSGTIVFFRPDENTLTLERLIRYSTWNGRICPKPAFWEKIWEKLNDKRRVGSGWEPPLPLILAAWDMTSNLEKKARFREHLEWADQHNQLVEIAHHVYSLTEDQWFQEDIDTY